MSKDQQPSLLSTEDLDLLKHNWSISNGYYRGYYKGKTENLHKVIQLRVGFEGFCDHINGNKLDNRRENLRPATKAQNAYNQSKNKSNNSGFKGVHWEELRGKWRARIKIEGRNKHLGYFDTKEEAAAAYKAVATLLHGEYYSD